MSCNRQVFEALVMGGGINGLSTLYHLARSGLKKIVLLERWKVGHSWGSSHGVSRITRSAYSHADYVRLMQWCHAEEWPRLEKDIGRKFIHPNPGCFFGPQGGKFALYAESVENAKGNVERVTPKKARKIFPQIKFEDSMGVLLDHTAGIIAADQVIQNLYRFLKKSKAEILEETEVLEIDPSADPIILKTNRGALQTERLVVTAGSWASRFFDFLKPKLKVARQTVGYFKLKGAQKKFQIGKFPVWIYLDDRPEYFFYGLPQFNLEGIKVARHYTEGKNDNPDDVGSKVDSAEEKTIAEFLKNILIPPIEKIVKTEHCLYTYTTNEDFIIDLHPTNKRVAIGSACSGHGFKFGPLTGRILTELVLNGKTTIPVFEEVRRRFAL